MGDNKIETKTYRQQVYDRLKELIMSGQYLPKQQLSMRQLANDFGVSMMPIREALWQMESEKIVVIESNKKITINSLTREEAEQIYDVRNFLETKLVQEACSLIKPETIDYLESLLKELENKSMSFYEKLSYNKLFHFSIYAIPGHTIYLEIIEALWMRMAPYFAAHHELTSINDIDNQSHKKMLTALKRNKPEMIAEAIKIDQHRTKAILINLNLFN